MSGDRTRQKGTKVEVWLSICMHSCAIPFHVLDLRKWIGPKVVKVS